MSATPAPLNVVWLEATPLRELLALERRWLATQRESIASGARVWLAPAVVPADDDAVPLTLDAAGKVGGALRADAGQLPFADGSLRGLVLQHALDQPVPKEFFGECVRVLATQGELIVFGLNPWSAWRPWLSVNSGRHQARTRTRVVGRLRALFVQLGLGFHELRWLGPRYPSAEATPGEIPGPARATDLMRASYVLTLRKPHDTVIPLLRRQPTPAIAMSPGLVPTRRVSARASAP